MGFARLTASLVPDSLGVADVPARVPVTEDRDSVAEVFPVNSELVSNVVM